MVNLISLCATHHLRGVHMGRVRIRGLPPDRLRWELGIGEGGVPRRVFVRPAPGADQPAAAMECSMNGQLLAM
jgi:hypothetical protein